MEGIPKSRLEELRDLLKGESLAKSFIESLIAECTELPNQQWHTIDEFKANPVDGWCHVSCGDKKELAMAFFEDGVFWYNDLFKGSNNFYHVKITHVMPIKTPEAPK